MAPEDFYHVSCMAPQAYLALIDLCERKKKPRRSDDLAWLRKIENSPRSLAEPGESLGHHLAGRRQDKESIRRPATMEWNGRSLL